MRRWMVRLLAAALVLTAGTAATPASSAATLSVADVTAVGQGLTAAVSWQDGDRQGVSGYVVTASPQLAPVTVPAGANSAVLSGLQPGVAYTVAVTAQTSSGPAATVTATHPVTVAAPGGTYTPLTPAVLLDTHAGVGAPKRATASVSVSVAGHGRVPVRGVQAVMLNISVASAGGDGQLTAFAAGTARPRTWSMAYGARRTTTELVLARLGVRGQVTMAATGRVELSAAVVGYYSTAQAASASSVSSKGLYVPVTPTRLLDTRTSGPGKQPGPGATVAVQVGGHGGVPSKGASAVVLNVTASAPTATGSVTVFPARTRRPQPVSLTFNRGLAVTNRVIVPLGAGGQVSLFNSTGHTQLQVDVTGWYTDGGVPAAGGSYFVASAPQRLVDTRAGLGAAKGPLAAGGALTVQVAGRPGVPTATTAMPPTAAALSVTVVAPRGGGSASVYPSLTRLPAALDLVAAPGQSATTSSLAGVGVDGADVVHNAGAPADYVVDLTGYYLGGIDIPSSTVTPAAGAVTGVTGTPGGAQTVTLAPSVAAPRIGQILTSATTPSAPAGLLAQVTGVSTDAQGAVVVQTQPATLQQALGTADVSVTAPLGADDVVASAGAAVTPHRAVVRTAPTLGVAELRSRTAATAGPGGPLTGKAQLSCAIDGSSQVTTTHSITPTLYFHAQIGHRGLLPTLSAQVGAAVSETLGAGLTFSGNAGCRWDQTLAHYDFRPITFFVGDVPVVVFPDFTLTLHASADGSAAITTSVTQNITADAGLSYDSTTNRATPYATLSKTFSHTGPTVTPAHDTAEVTLVGDLEGKLYDVVGPEVLMTADLTGYVNADATPWWRLRLTLDINAALHMKMLFANVDVDVSFRILDAVLAQATVPLPTTRTITLNPVPIGKVTTTPPRGVTATIDCTGITGIGIGDPRGADSMYLSVNGGPQKPYNWDTTHIAVGNVRGTIVLDVLMIGDATPMGYTTDDWRYTYTWTKPAGC